MTETMVSRAPLDQPPSPEVATGVSWLRRIMVSHFRNYHAAEIICDSRPLVLTGPNGAGKTNLLEAVSLLAPGRGLRGAKMGDLDRHEPATGKSGKGLAGSWAVAAEVVTPEGQYDLGTGRPPPPDGGGSSDRRIVKVDGAVVRGHQRLGEILGIVWVTPQMDGLFREAPSGRRRFLDRLVFGFDPAHAGRVNAYDHARRERARLLKSNHKDDAWLLAVEDNMARHGVAIAVARQSATTRLAAAAATGVGPFPAAGLALACRLQDWLQEMPALAAEEAFKRALADARATDALSGTTALGPHRSDLVVTHLERNMDAELCSTGEQKALLVSIILAHTRLLRLDRGGAPLLLLDEVAAHLDADRRRALYEEILALSAQAWLTGTDPDVFAELGDAAQFFEVSHARVAAGNVARGS